MVEKSSKVAEEILFNLRCWMKPYLVDVPVRVNIWIRPKCQRKQFEVLKQARPSIMFLQSDGGRNDKEWEAIHKNRKNFR